MKAKILDAAGRGEEAQKLLTQGLSRSVFRPQVAQEASMLLARHGRHEEAAALLVRAIDAAPGNSELLLAHAIVLALMDRDSAGEKRLNEIESRWPEWDRPYLVHGLLLEGAGRKAEAAQKLRIAVALGLQDPAGQCALGRISSSPQPGPHCACVASLRDWLFPSCGGR
jgi:hypothetical protein